MILFKLFGVIDVRMADILDILLISIILYYFISFVIPLDAGNQPQGFYLLKVEWVPAE